MTRSGRHELSPAMPAEPLAHHCGVLHIGPTKPVVVFRSGGVPSGGHTFRAGPVLVLHDQQRGGGDSHRQRCSADARGCGTRLPSSAYIPLAIGSLPASTHWWRCHGKPMVLPAQHLTLCRCSPSTGSTAYWSGGASASTSSQTRLLCDQHMRGFLIMSVVSDERIAVA